MDPRGLIFESYRIDGITEGECRSIFMDWALGTPDGSDMQDLAGKLLTKYEADHPTHPMTSVLRDGTKPPVRKGRRGGRSARVS